MTEIEKNLKKMADEIPVPEKLLPDQIEKKLKNNRKKPHRYVRGVCVAAAAVIVVGAGVMMWQNQKNVTAKTADNSRTVPKHYAPARYSGRT